jgi:hypothetical protein
MATSKEHQKTVNAPHPLFYDEPDFQPLISESPRLARKILFVFVSLPQKTKYHQAICFPAKF